MSENLVEKILLYMQTSGADIMPLKTRTIADAMGISVYRARYYLYELQSQALIESDNAGRGQSLHWRLIR